ncbi:COP1-interacting protein 7 isoform X2 [Euphorbia lathyris]|uniref:COP1-interacting protein 7 isoform X2 n=1 Tax=Euphorbia lathyris TaxID=212925 RepID=UPI00331408FF
MGSSTLLDYALFQLTPTRTRCDLILFYGGKTEKLASGLFEPFISHLKFAKDHISRGGYSIKLCPPTPYATWFTKATFARFVRFVSTPAVLERFVLLEKEILQIESSAQANGLLNTNMTGQLEEVNGLAVSSITKKPSNPSKVKGEIERSNGDGALEENSKIQLQRLLETRKTLLRKEQAMAYARGLVAGFEADSMDDLISFADAFGASRLREACIDFKELCKKKRGDGLWMQELAAMQACSPAELTFPGTSEIVLNSDASSLDPNITLNFPSNGSKDASRSDSTDDNSATSDQMPSTTTKVQMPMSWPNQIPQYMYNFQNPIPPYQGYPFPMHPHYAMNMQWPSGLKESGSVKKEKLNKKGHRDSEEEQTESSNSDTGSDSDSFVPQDKKHSSTDASTRKKHRKRSSKTVVIRNINYITPKRRNGDSNESSDEDDFIDEDSLRQQVDDAVGSLEKLPKSNSSSRRKDGSHKKNGIPNGSAGAEDSNDSSEGAKKNENWDTFQNFLMTDEVTTNGSLHSKDVQDEHFTLTSSGDVTSLAIIPSMDFESEKAPKRQVYSGDSFVATRRDGGSEDVYKMEDIENGEIRRAVMKRRDSTDGELVIPLRTDESGSGFRGNMYETESSAIKPGKGEDWFVMNHNGKPENQNSSNTDIIFNGHCLNNEKNQKDFAIDDSFMVHDREPTHLHDSQWKTDISMAADLVLSSKTENSTSKENHERRSSCEPDDLYVVFERNSEFETARGSWADHGIESMDISVMETDTRRSSIGTDKDAGKNLPSNCDSTDAKKKVPNGRKVPGKDAKPKIPPGSIGNNKSGMLSRTKKPFTASRPLVQKSKMEQEEEIRKKVEELAIQRQKRIAERTAATGVSKQVKGSTPRTVRRQTM